MKYLFYRLTALLLAVMLFCSTGGVFALAAQGELPDPACALGTSSSAMLAGGGRQVETERGRFFLDDSGNIRQGDGKGVPVTAGPAARLNYDNGVLYFARTREEGSFDLCAYDLDEKKETVLLANFSGTPGQIYLVNGTILDFACGEAVWELDLERGDYRLIRYAEGLRSFVPTGCGLLYAVGPVFDYELYAEELLIAEHVESYYVDFRDKGATLVYSQASEDYQMDLGAAFAGQSQPAAFTGYAYTELSASVEQELTEEEKLAEFEAEAVRLEQEHEEMEALYGEPDPIPAPPDPALADPDDPQLPEDLFGEPAAAEAPAETVAEELPEEETEAAAEEAAEALPEAPAEAIPEETAEASPEEPAKEVPEAAAEKETPAEGAPEQEAPAETPAEQPVQAPAGTDVPAAEEAPVCVETAPAEPTAVFSGDGLRRSVSTGMQNIVRRARQMLNVPWTAKKGVAGWGYDSAGYEYYHKIYYSAGKSYKGVPYGWTTGSLGPWNASLTKFVTDSKDASSVFYTHHSGGRGSQHYGLECSGFVSWAWNLPAKTGNNNSNGLAASKYSTRVGKDYTKIQIGDALVREDNSWSHSRLVTDVVYESDGVTIYAIEVAEANPTTSYNGCCYTTLYAGSNLSKVVSGSYAIYRSNTRNSTAYTHECVVPLEGDSCEICGAGGSWDDPYAGMYVKPGVDVSYAQGTISWKELAPRISFAIVRIGYTGTKNPVIGKDSYFETNLKGCEQNNVPYGIYFYAGATTPEQAVQEAEAVLEYLGFMSGNPHLPPLGVYYDVEQQNNILSLNDTELLAVISAFCGTIEDCGLKAGVYASTNIWNTRLQSSEYNKWVRWVAQWGTNTLTASGGAHLWQYDNNGAMPGVSAKIDLDYWLGDVGDFTMRCTATKTAPGCETRGTLTCTCLDNGESLELPIHALGHLWGEETITTEATCVNDGVMTRCCSRCGEARTETYSDPNNHNYVNYICIRCDALAFTDVKPGKYYYNAVRWAVQNGISSGTGDKSFSPNHICTRAQVMTFLWKACGSPSPSANAPTFSDVSNDAYYAKAVRWAAERGITSGVGGGRFGVNSACTREQVITFLWKAAGKPAHGQAECPFSDVKPGSYYYDAVLWATGRSIASGVSSDRFGVGEGCTRAQTVTFLYKVYGQK